MLITYVTVLAWIFWLASILVVISQIYHTHKESGGRSAIIGIKTILIGILSFAWLVTVYHDMLKTILLWSIIGLGCLLGIFLIAYFTTIVFEHINKTSRMKNRMLQEQKK